MARTNTLGNFLTDVADAIREKKGTSDTIQASNFDTEIANLPSASGLDWSTLGYEPAPQGVVDDYNYSKEIYDNWIPSENLTQKFSSNINLIYMPLVDTSSAVYMQEMFRNCQNLENIPLLNTSNVTNMSYMFISCSKLTTIPLLNTSNVTNFTQMFYGCTSLTTIPLLNTSSVTNFTQMFYGCRALNDESLDNILQMCINATSYNGTKTLQTLAIQNTTSYPSSRMQALPHYQDFINAGWTLGY